MNVKMFLLVKVVAPYKDWLLCLVPHRCRFFYHGKVANSAANQGPGVGDLHECGLVGLGSPRKRHSLLTLIFNMRVAGVEIKCLFMVVSRVVGSASNPEFLVALMRF